MTSRNFKVRLSEFGSNVSLSELAVEMRQHPSDNDVVIIHVDDSLAPLITKLESQHHYNRQPYESPFPTITDNIGSWHYKGVLLNESTQLKFSYDGDDYLGVVVNEMLEFTLPDGTKIRERAPSTVVMDVINAHLGEDTVSNMNGWRYLKFMDSETGKWRDVDGLRDISKS